MTMRRLTLAAAMTGLAALGACTGLKPETKPGVCYQVTFPKGQPPAYHVVAQNVPNLEGCAAKLEGIRISFLGMGGSIHEIAGAFGDQFLFLDPSGVYASRTLTGPRYVFMARNYDGRLVRPGAGDTIPQDEAPSGKAK